MNNDLEKSEILIAQILRIGIFICALVILVGWIFSLNKIIMDGLLLLICLPIARVFAALIIFLKQKDYIYVLLSTYVLIVLITSLALGKVL